MRGAAGRASAVTGSGGCRRCLGRQAGSRHPGTSTAVCWRLLTAGWPGGTRALSPDWPQFRMLDPPGPISAWCGSVGRRNACPAACAGQDRAGNQSVRKAKDDLSVPGMRGRAVAVICCVEENGLRAQPQRAGWGARAPSEPAGREAMAVLGKAAPDTLCAGILGDGVTLCAPGHRFWQRAARRWGLWLGERCGEEAQGTCG